MPKVYLILTPFFPEADSFHGPFIYDQARAIARLSDYRVVVVKPYAFWQRGGDYEFGGVRVLRCPHYAPPSCLLPNDLSDVLSVRALVRKLKEEGIALHDIAVCHAHVTDLGFYAVRLKRMNPAIKTIVQHHGFDVMTETSGRLARFAWHKRWMQRYGRAICNAADLNVGVSRRTLDYVKAVPGVRLKREYILYNGVDTSVFNEGEGKPAHEGFIVGCVGNFWPLKDQLTLIRAAERLIRDGMDDLRVRFIGSGRTLADCEAYVREHGLSDHIAFLTEVAHDELPAFYRSLDLFVLPSYWEAFGCVYTEAFACGTPFMAVKGQGIAEIVAKEEADKWLIEKGDDHALAEKIKAYRQARYAQRLTIDVGIDSLVRQFLKEHVEES